MFYQVYGGGTFCLSTLYIPVYVLVKTQMGVLTISCSVLVAIMAHRGLLGIHARPFPYFGGVLLSFFTDTIYIIPVAHPEISSIVVVDTIFNHGDLCLPYLFKEFACFIKFMEVVLSVYLPYIDCFLCAIPVI